jgi:hypothetical protein
LIVSQVTGNAAQDSIQDIGPVAGWDSDHVDPSPCFARGKTSLGQGQNAVSGNAKIFVDRNLQYAFAFRGFCPNL